MLFTVEYIISIITTLWICTHFYLPACHCEKTGKRANQKSFQYRRSSRLNRSMTRLTACMRVHTVQGTGRNIRDPETAREI
jgi:hypothetical protein